MLSAWQGRDNARPLLPYFDGLSPRFPQKATEQSEIITSKQDDPEWAAGVYSWMQSAEALLHFQAAHVQGTEDAFIFILAPGNLQA